MGDRLTPEFRRGDRVRVRGDAVATIGGGEVHPGTLSPGRVRFVDRAPDAFGRPQEPAYGVEGWLPGGAVAWVTARGLRAAS